MFGSGALLAFALLCSSALAHPGDREAGAHQTSHPRKRPNIIFIITDDQDQRLNSLEFQPAVRQHFREQGTYFENHYCTISVCCPSRVSLLTGRHAHNTNVTSVNLPFGGYAKFAQEGLNGKWLPSYLQQASYNTYYTGKLMNNHSVVNYNAPFPAGFNATDFLIDPGTYLYYNATMQSNRDPPRSLPGQYSTDVVAQRGVEFLDLAAASSDPFFLVVAPIAPHGETIIPPTIPGRPRGLAQFNAPVAAEKHKELYPNVKVPRTPNFNPDEPSGVSYIRNLSQWNQTVIDYYDAFYRTRLQTLASVDDLIDSIVAKTDALGITDNTFIIYTSDNGFHIGQHRLPAGKSCTIEEDINIPFFIRGPGVAKNVTAQYPTSHVDIAPTLFEIAGIPQRPEFDGSAMPIWEHQHLDEPQQHHEQDHGHSTPAPRGRFTRAEHVNVEYWGTNFAEGKYGDELLDRTKNNNTYKSLRLISTDKTYNLNYVVWCTNEHELYDLNSDPYQLRNLAVTWDDDGDGDGDDSDSSPSAGPKLGPRPRQNTFSSSSPFRSRRPGSSHTFPNQTDRTSLLRLQARLDTLLLILKTCRADTCRDPWASVHPDGEVKSLRQALDRRYDDLYVRRQPKVAFGGCAEGYLREVEGPGEDRGDVVVQV